MTQQATQGHSDDVLAIHEYYMDIINCMPNIVYWVDIDCELKGCNNRFVKLLGTRRLDDFLGTPYEHLINLAQWSADRVESLKLDDMAVIFSGQASYEIVERPVYDKKERALYFLSTRVPLFDKEKRIIGLVVILNDITDRNETEKPRAVTKPVGLKRRSKKSPRILMVEDNLVAQKVEQALLTALNCQVDIAESGEQAIKLFSPGKYDLVFMDIGLQDTSGYIVAKKIREMEEETQYHIPIIALTSYQADVVKDDCIDYSMEGVISKPLTSDQAKQIIERYIYNKNILVDWVQSER